MLLKIAKEIVESYPHTEIGYVIAKIDVKKTDSYIENIKSILIKHLNDSGITSKNYSDHPQIAGWRNVFKNFGMSHKTHRSSVEALVKRIVTGGKMWSISNVVDLYNCCSVLSMLPMGGYDLAHIKTKIELRYGREGDTFDPLGMTEPVTIDSKHAVYADDDKVICWLWNFRDSKFTSISESTKHAIFFLDSAFPMAHIKMKDAILLFQDGLSKIEGTEITHNGILSNKNMEVEIGFENHDRTITDENEHGLFDALLNKTIVFKGILINQMDYYLF